MEDFLSGYNKRRELNQEADARAMQQGVQVMSLLKEQRAMQADARLQQEDEAFRQAIASDLPPEQKLMAIVKSGPRGGERAHKYFDTLKAIGETQAMQTLDPSNPDALRRVGITTKNPTLIAEADRQDKRRAATAEHQTQLGIETPITETPQMGFQPRGGLAERAVLPQGGAMVPKGTPFPNSNHVTAEDLPQEVFDAMSRAAVDPRADHGIAYSDRPAANPAENVQRSGGLFEQFANDPIRIGQANANQRMLTGSDPQAIPPQKWNDLASQMNTRAAADRQAELTRQQTLAIAGMRDATAQRGQDLVDSRFQPREPRPERFQLIKDNEGKTFRINMETGEMSPVLNNGAPLVQPTTNNAGLGKSVQQLGKDLTKAGLPQMAQVIEEALNVTESQAQYITGPQSALPDRAIPKDAVLARQAITKLFNITLKDRSGAAVTYQELERLKQEFGAGLIKTTDALMNAIQKAKNIIDAHYFGIAATYGKDALDEYNKNLEAVGGRPFVPSAQRPQAGAAREGAIKNVNGKAYVFMGGDWYEK